MLQITMSAMLFIVIVVNIWSIVSVNLEHERVKHG